MATLLSNTGTIREWACFHPLQAALLSYGLHDGTS